MGGPIRRDGATAMSRSELIDLTMHLHHETEKAILVSDDGDRAKAVWLPKSAVEFDDADGRGSGIVVVTLRIARHREGARLAMVIRASTSRHRA